LGATGLQLKFVVGIFQNWYEQGKTSSRRCYLVCIRVIRKVRKTQHQNPEFGHTQSEIFKKPARKKYISIQWGMKLRKPSILVVN
jgi:hypothetical protein